MKIAAIIVTIIATLLYIVTTNLLINDPIGRSDKPGAHLLNFFMWYTVPIILWVVYFIMNEIKKPNSIISSFTKNNSTGTNYIYHTHVNGVTSEPLTYNQLKAKNITKDTYVWRNGIDWIKASELRELNPLFEQNGPPPFDKYKLNDKKSVLVFKQFDKDKLNEKKSDLVFKQLIGIIILFFIALAIFMNYIS